VPTSATVISGVTRFSSALRQRLYDEPIADPLRFEVLFPGIRPVLLSDEANRDLRCGGREGIGKTAAKREQRVFEALVYRQVARDRGGGGGVALAARHLRQQCPDFFLRLVADRRDLDLSPAINHRDPGRLP
jgi:hypothetical protein